MTHTDPATKNAIIAVALKRMASQLYVPRSPADFDEEGEITLCAAACLAFAGLSVTESPSEARAFERRIADSRDSGLIESAFEQIGWSKSSCNYWMQQNDVTPPDVRKREMLRMLARAVANVER